MAKDKSKKKDKAVEVEETKKPKKDKGGKGSGSSEFGRPSEAKGGGDSWSLTDGDDPKSGSNEGELLLMTPLREEEQDVKRGGKTETQKVIVADVVVINTKKPEKSEAHEEVFVWGGWLKGGLRSYIGEQKVLARLVKEKDKTSPTGYVWKFEDGDDDDIEAARAYLQTVDVFKQKKSK